jgi:hypothetical protein
LGRRQRGWGAADFGSDATFDGGKVGLEGFGSEIRVKDFKAGGALISVQSSPGPIAQALVGPEAVARATRRREALRRDVGEFARWACKLQCLYQRLETGGQPG